mmetsp:Transcript_42240/g.132281  ORF Transcript_42240/g.132281 Transcript_42240/m.132281 type:complete len:323 (-) Transcript_42240:32-1000(-)
MARTARLLGASALALCLAVVSPLRLHSTWRMAAGDASRRSVALGGLGILGSLALPPPPASAKIGTIPEYAENAGAMRALTVNSVDVEKSVNFYTVGMGMTVLQEPKVVGGKRTAVLAYGPTEMRVPKAFVPGVSSFAEYGGHVALRLQEAVVADGAPKPFYAAGNVIDFVQLGVPSIRLSKLYESGGDVQSSYGWTDVISPDGLRHRVVLGRRRDPVMMVAIKTNDMKGQGAALEAAGMTKQPYPLARPVENSPYEPPKPKDSVYYSYDAESPGILLGTLTLTLTRTLALTLVAGRSRDGAGCAGTMAGGGTRTRTPTRTRT